MWLHKRSAFLRRSTMAPCASPPHKPWATECSWQWPSPRVSVTVRRGGIVGGKCREPVAGHVLKDGVGGQVVRVRCQQRLQPSSVDSPQPFMYHCKDCLAQRCGAVPHGCIACDVAADTGKKDCPVRVQSSPAQVQPARWTGTGESSRALGSPARPAGRSGLPAIWLLGAPFQ